MRLKEYDYSQVGAYFMTICTKDRECMFGDISNGKMRLNEYGKIAREEWLQTGVIRSDVGLDEFIVMPNHIHGIIVLNDVVGATRWVAQNKTIQYRAIHRIAPTLQPNSIGAIIGQFKSIVAKKINKIRNFTTISVWQRNYYEHVARNEDSLNRIREYISNNPLKWEDDIENPLNDKKEDTKAYYGRII
jgi:REP element-mobilizing transposase RayT